MSYHPRRPLMIGGLGIAQRQDHADAAAEATNRASAHHGAQRRRLDPGRRDRRRVAVTDTDGRARRATRCGPAGNRGVAPRRAGHVVAHRPIQAAATIRGRRRGTERARVRRDRRSASAPTSRSLELRHVNPVGQHDRVRRRPVRPCGRRREPVHPRGSVPRGVSRRRRAIYENPGVSARVRGAGGRGSARWQPPR